MSDIQDKLVKDVNIEDALIDDMIQRHTRKKIKRVPLRKARKLNVSIDLDSNYHYYIANNTGDNLQTFLNAGYGFVENEAFKKEKKDHKDVSYATQFGKYISYNVGGGIKGYLMKIKKDLWEKEERRSDEENEKVEKDIGLDKLPPWLRRGKVTIDSSIEESQKVE